MSAVQTEGWYSPPTATRFHYFRKGHSLCGKWAVFAADASVPWDCSVGTSASRDCAACKRARDKEVANHAA